MIPRYRYFLVYLYALSRGGLEEVYLVYQVNIYSKHLILEIRRLRNRDLCYGGSKPAHRTIVLGFLRAYRDPFKPQFTLPPHTIQ